MSMRNSLCGSGCGGGPFWRGKSYAGIISNTAIDVNSIDGLIGGSTLQASPARRRYDGYDRFQRRVKDMRMALQGSEAVKEVAVERNWVILPDCMRPEVNPSLSGPEAYKRQCEYVDMADYPEILKFAIQITRGRIMRRDPICEGLDDEKDRSEDEAKVFRDIDNVDTSGRSLKKLAEYLIDEKFSVGGAILYPMQVDRNTATIKTFKIEQYCGKLEDPDTGELRSIVFQEFYDDQTDGKRKVRYRELMLDEANRFNDRIWIHDKGSRYVIDLNKSTIPTIGGKPLSVIPVVIDGDLPPDRDFPFDALRKKALHAFRISAQLEYKLWKQHQEWVVIEYSEEQQQNGKGGGIRDPYAEEKQGDGEGVSEEAPLVFGDGILEIDKGTIRILEGEGKGITHQREHLNDCKKEMAFVGARFGINYGSSNISENTERMQQSGETAFIVSHIDGTSEALTAIMRWKSLLEGKSETAVKEISIQLNSELTDEGRAWAIENLCTVWAKNGMSGETFWMLLKILIPEIPEDREWTGDEGEFARIVAEATGQNIMLDEEGEDGIDEELDPDA